MVKRRLTAQERYAQVVKVAMRLFSQKGFKGTTTRTIAQQAGISEAIIFKHFAKKEDLYSAIIDMQCNDRQGQSILMKRLENKKGREIFKEIASFLIQKHRDDPTFMKLLMFSALEGHKLSNIFMKTRGMETLDFLAKYINNLIKNGRFKKMEARLAARAFLGMVLYYSITQEVYGMKKFFRTPVKRVVDTFVDIFFEGMKRRRG
ncbi:MAG: TetR/AcrR family transcriptional regulator [Deltaproteobacteria bacterium]|nr:TetR/AcrR family transcriptional regulator [Deltaproteobacteria bacterium]MBI3755849.1 TetR/AcrR family transcriptional regulator [Deltaproteobacteria bacterium]